MFPVFVLLVRSLRLCLILLVCFIAVSVITPKIITDLGLPASFRSMNFPYNLLYFQTGVLVYSSIRHLKKTSRFQKLATFWSSKATKSVLFSFFALAFFQYFQVPAFLILATACVAWTFAAYLGLPLGLNNAFTRFGGKLSYGLYLVHPFILWTLSKAGIFAAISVTFVDPYLTFIGCAFVTVSVVFLFAFLTYILVESPSIRLGEHLTHKLGNSMRDK